MEWDLEIVGSIGDWKRFLKTAEEICKRSLVKDVDEKKDGSGEEKTEHVQTTEAETRRASKMKEREKHRL